MKKQIFILALFILAGTVFANVALAQPVCPVCTVAIVGGLGFSRWLGVDDLVSSVWIGAGLLTIVYWTNFWLEKKKWNFKFYKTAVVLFYYVLSLLPLYFLKIIGQPLNTVFGIDKIILGAVLGTAVLLFGLKLHSWLKKNNNDKSYFPYQRVAVPVAILILTSLIFYLLLIWKII